MRQTFAQLDREFVVLNGDTLLDVNFGGLEALGRADPEVAVVLTLREVPDAGRYGSITLEGDRVTRFMGKAEAAPGGFIVGSTGCAALRWSDYRKEIVPWSAICFPPWRAAGDLRGYPCPEYFIDIGLPETYGRAQAELPAWEARRLLS